MCVSYVLLKKCKEPFLLWVANCGWHHCLISRKHLHEWLHNHFRNSPQQLVVSIDPFTDNLMRTKNEWVGFEGRGIEKGVHLINDFSQFFLQGIALSIKWQEKGANFSFISYSWEVMSIHIQGKVRFVKDSSVWFVDWLNFQLVFQLFSLLS